MCFKYFQKSCPTYVAKMLKTYVCPKTGLRSEKDDCSLESFKMKIRRERYGGRSFSYNAPEAWNSLPFEIRKKESLESFKSSLKTYLFRKHYLWVHLLAQADHSFHPSFQMSFTFWHWAAFSSFTHFYWLFVQSPCSKRGSRCFVWCLCDVWYYFFSNMVLFQSFI